MPTRAYVRSNQALMAAALAFAAGLPTGATGSLTQTPLCATAAAAGFDTTQATADTLAFQAQDDAELGYTFSQPIIAMMNNGQWAAIFGSGYNDTSDNLNAHLFIVFLEDGVDGVWTAGTDYLKIPAPINGIAERNGMSSPAVVDLDGNFTIDRVYAGDLLGNLWAFDVSDAYTTRWSARNLFTATDSQGNPQPITAKPAIANHPGVSDIVSGAADDNQPNLMVYFGTGQFLTDADKTTTGEQSFYGVWDRDVFDLTRAGLQPQTFQLGYNNQVVTDTAVDWTSQYGWYVDLPGSGNDASPGERVVAGAILRGGIVFFNSIVPSEDSCSGFLYALDMINGGRPDDPPFDTNGDGVVDITDKVEGEVVSRKSYGVDFGMPSPPTVVGDMLYTAGSVGQIKETRLAPLPQHTGRLSWQQLYRD